MRNNGEEKFATLVVLTVGNLHIVEHQLVSQLIQTTSPILPVVMFMFK